LEIKNASLLDLDIRFYEMQEFNSELHSAYIVNEKTNHVLCQTDKIFFNIKEATTLLGKIIGAIQSNKKSLIITTKTKYLFKVS